MPFGGAQPEPLPVFVEAGDLLVQLGIGVRVGLFLLLCSFVEGVHVGLLSGHVFLKALGWKRKRMKEGGEYTTEM